MEPKYQLILTKEQAWNVAMACEFYARILMGQFGEIPFRLMIHDRGDDFCKRRDEAERLLFEARKHIYPELHGAGHSYGIGKFDDADMAYDVFQVIRKAIFPDAAPVFSYQKEVPEIRTADSPTKQQGAYVLCNVKKGVPIQIGVYSGLHELVNAAANYVFLHGYSKQKLTAYWKEKENEANS